MTSAPTALQIDLGLWRSITYGRAQLDKFFLGAELMPDREPTPDFFISRAGADMAIASAIGAILEKAGYRVVLQQWDFANRSFMERMHWALKSGARVIALLSNDYLTSDHCNAEWLNAIGHDPLNKNGHLILLRVAECTPSGLLTAIAYWDLTRVRADQHLLRDIVLTAVKPGRHEEDDALAGYWRPPRRCFIGQSGQPAISRVAATPWTPSNEASQHRAKPW